MAPEVLVSPVSSHPPSCELWTELSIHRLPLDFREAPQDEHVQNRTLPLSLTSPTLPLSRPYSLSCSGWEAKSSFLSFSHAHIRATLPVSPALCSLPPHRPCHTPPPTPLSCSDNGHSIPTHLGFHSWTFQGIPQTAARVIFAKY